MILEDLKKLAKDIKVKDTKVSCTMLLYTPDMPGTQAQIREILKKNKIKYKEAIVRTVSRSSPTFEFGEPKVFRVSTKPGKGGGRPPNLKPQAFGIQSPTPYASISAYYKAVIDGIEKNNTLSGTLKQYLIALVNYWYGENVSTHFLKEAYAAGLPVKEINKDFAEILGPIAIVKHQLLKAKTKATISNTANVFVPVRPNEPLMDYKIIDGDKNFVISAKSGTNTNTVKPGDVIGLLEKDDKVFRKWNNSAQFEILTELANSSIIGGPVRVCSKMKMAPIKYADALEFEKRKDQYTIGGFTEFIQNNDYLKNVKGKPSAYQISRECEKIIEQASKSKYDFTELFQDAIHLKVIYVKFELDTKGIGDWEVIVSNDMITNKRVSLRSKNAYTRMEDRMGIQT